MKKEYLVLFCFALILVLFAAFSKIVIFHDSGEYVTIAKNFAGVKNVGLFSTHSLLYPLIISPFLMIWPSLTMLKIVNCLWIFLIGLVLFLWLKDKRAFLIFVFSPLAWHVSIQTTPVLPASFFFLLAYIFIKRTELKYRFVLSGISLGLSYAVYDPMFFIIAVFIPVYFWDKKFYQLFTYLVFVGIGFLPRLILDFYLFKMPFYSIIRFFGTNMIVSLGLYPGISNALFFSDPKYLEILLIVFIVSPFLYKLYKLDFKEHGRDLIFLAIAGILLLVRCAMFKYFLIIAPVALILLAKVLTNKEIKWHCILSIFIIAILTAGFFTSTREDKISSDLKEITQDYKNASHIISATEATTLATFLWKNNPQVAWYADFDASNNNLTALRGYNFGFKSRINLRDRLVISASFDRFENKTYENYIFVSDTSDLAVSENNMKGYTRDKCYEILCVYK